MKVLVAIVILLSIGSFAWAIEPLSTESKILGLSFLALEIVDWGQTHYIADHPEEYTESNPILGNHPSRREVNAWFIGSTVVCGTIFFFLPDKYRSIFAAFGFGLEFNAVLNNYRSSVRFSF